MNMTSFNIDDRSRCTEVRALLSEYTDSSLSGRQAWEVEKHLAGCGACAAEAREMQATVQLLRAAPRFDTSDTFMASLHARLDTVDPRFTSDRSTWGRIKGWLSGSDSALVRSRVPVLGLGLAATALALMMATNRPVENTPAIVPSVSSASDGVHVSVAASASSPFSDPAADNLEYRADARSSGSPKSF